MTAPGTVRETGGNIDQRNHSFEAEIQAAEHFDALFRQVLDPQLGLVGLRDTFSEAWRLIKNQDDTYVVPSTEAWATYADYKFASNGSSAEQRSRAGRALAAAEFATVDGQPNGTPAFYRDVPNGCAVLFDRNGLVEIRDELVGRGVTKALEGTSHDVDGLALGAIKKGLDAAKAEDPVYARYDEYRSAAVRKALLAALASRIQAAHAATDAGHLHLALEETLIEWELAERGEVPQLTLGYAFDTDSGTFIGVTGKLAPKGYNPLADYPEYVTHATVDGRAPQAGPEDTDWLAGHQDECYAQTALRNYLHPELAGRTPAPGELGLRVRSNNNVF